MAGEIYNPYSQGTSASAGAGIGGANPYMQAGVAAIGTVAGIAGDVKGSINEFRDMDVSVGGLREDFQGRPQYDLLGDIQKLSGLRTSEPGKGLIGRSVLSGLTGGAAAGSVVPGWGTAIGAVGGAIGGLFAGLFGKQKAIRERDEKLRELDVNIDRKQEAFNVSNERFYEAQTSREVFNIQQERRENRMYNIPSFNSIY